jgi:hypothetical protein
MTLRQKVLAVRDARTSLQKARALNAAIDALQAEIGPPAHAMLKADQPTGLRRQFEGLQGRIDNLQRMDASPRPTLSIRT